MLINPEIWRNPLPWNDFRGTYIEFRNQLIITTSKFTENYINEKNRTRLGTIWKLHKRGWSNREITDFLNIFGIKKRNTKTNYSIKDIFMCLKKLKIRKKRLSKIECVVGEWLVWGQITKNRFIQ